MFTVRQILSGGVVGLAVLAASPVHQAQGAISITVVPSSAPNVFGSPSFSGYAANALTALQNGLTTVGNRSTDPTAYVSFANGSSINAGNAIVTSYSSWLGTANPPAPFASELGNRLHFGLVAVGDGTQQFSLDDVQFAMHSNDSVDTFNDVGDLSGLTYNGTTRIGVSFGPDHHLGGGDDIVYNSGQSGSTPIDELFYVGIGNGFAPTAADPSQDQSAINDTYSYIAANEPYNVTTAYTILGNTGSATVTLVPEPTSLAMLAIGGLTVLRRRRRAC